MKPRFKRTAIAVVLAPALLLPAALSAQQDQQQAQARQNASRQDVAQSQQQPQAAVAMPMQRVMQMIADWPNTSKHAAKQMIDKYGAPAEATPTRLVWFENGPWKRTVVLAEEFNHDFPLPHKDVMEQVVNYEVPPDKFDDLARFDGSVYVDRTRGEISARCDSEAANLIALNLANDIVTGKRSVEEARQTYPKMLMAFMHNKPAPYAQRLTFETLTAGAGFSDEPVVSQQMIQQARQTKQQMIASDRQQGGVADQPGGGLASRGQQGGDQPGGEAPSELAVPVPNR